MKLKPYQIDATGGTPGQGLGVVGDEIAIIDLTGSGGGQADVGIEYDTVDVDAYRAQDDAVIRLDLTEPSHLASDEATHPSVLHFPEKWNGWHYWMAFTPYEGGSNATEDPCIAVSQDGVIWQAPTGLVNPLDDAPGGTRYNSDPELAISPDGATLYLIWRQRDDAATGVEEIIYLRSSTDGVTWTARASVLTANKATEILASPAVLWDGTQWVMWTVDVAAAPNVLKRRTAAAVTGPWSAATACTVAGLPAGRDLWHLSVIQLAGQYVALLNDCELGVNGVGGELYLMRSTDQLAWTLSADTIAAKTLAGNYDALYRGALVPTFENGRLELRMWHGAWMSGATPRWGIYHRRLAQAATGTASPGVTVEDESVPVASGVTHLDFQGDGVSVSSPSTGRVVVTIPGGTATAGAGELLMQDGVTAPPVPLENEARDDWLYEG